VSPTDEDGGADPAREEMLLARLVERTTAGLRALLGPDGALRDPVRGGATPPDHYAATFTALALAARAEPDACWRLALDRWLAQPRRARGHAPFNRLALLLLRDHLQRRGPLLEEDRLRLGRALRTCSTVERYPSNNWALLAAACRILEARSDRLRRAAAARLVRLARPWFTPAGAFIDAPAQPSGRPVSTPLGYQAKALLMLRLAQLWAPDAAPHGLLARGLGFLLVQTDDLGRCGGFGRSSHALFGSTAMLALCLSGLRGGLDDGARRGWALRARRLRLLLEGMRRPDDLLSLTPNPASGAPGGWDEYMHLTVYNAWLAGIVSWLVARPGRADDPPLPVPDFTRLGPRPEVLAVDEHAGLLAVHGARGAGWLSLRGQPPQGYGPGAADLRWGGPLPFHLMLEGRAVVPPPVRVTLARLAAEPALAGWTPLVESGGRLFALQRFPACAVYADGARVLAVARGAPTAVAPLPPARGSPAWLVEHVDHVLLGGGRRRRLGEHPDTLAGASATAAFLVDALEGWCAAVLLLDGAPGVKARLLNPHGRALLPGGAALPLRVARWTFTDSPALPVEGWRLASTRSVALPSALPGGVGSCGAPLDWPADDLLLVTVLGPAAAAPDAALPLEVEPEGCRLVTSWTTVPLREPGCRAPAAVRRPEDVVFRAKGRRLL
jgi:hypothetical protein